MKQNKFLTRKEAAAFIKTFGLQISHTTLAKMAVEGGKGPDYRVWGSRRVVYSTESLLLWIKNRLSQPINNTSQTPTYDSEVKNER